MINNILPLFIERKEKNGVAPTWRLSQLSGDEFNEVVRYLTERMKNSLEMCGESRVIQALNLLTCKNIREDDTITIKLDMVFVWQDILEIVGGFRRKEKENENKRF